MSLIKYIQVDQMKQGQRIDNFLITQCKGIPKARLYRALRRGEVRVNKKRIKPEYRLLEQDIIRIPPFHSTGGEKSLSTNTINKYKFLLNYIEYEDNEWILINKPSGIPVHSGSFLHLGIIEALTHLRPKLKYLRLVHRLDRETSGCLLLAKKRSALLAVQNLMLKKRVEKRYTVLVKGVFEGDQQTVNLPLKKNRLHNGARYVKVDASGKTACTIFTRKQQFKSAALLEAVIITGRTHQIRVHAQAIGNPVAGDEHYGDRAFNQKMKSLGLKRLFLHASSLKFKINEKTFRFQISLPDLLQKVIDKLPLQ